jgi:uncharacterized protein (DUF2336 family)
MSGSEPPPQPEISARIAAALAAAEAVRRATPEMPLSGAARELLRLAIGDAAVRVRQTFAEAVKDLPSLPRDAAIALARDFESVAIPVLRHSPALTASDLIALVKLGSMPKQVAVSGRADVPALVADTIIEAENVEAIATLLENPHADISERLVRRIHEEWGHIDFIERALASRAGLPDDLASRLAWASLPSIERVSSDARERRITEAVAQPKLALREILKALLVGDHLFATEALARLSRMSEAVTATLLCDRGSMGVHALLRAAGLDMGYAGVLASAIATLREARYGIDSEERRAHARSCLTRIITRERALSVDQWAELEMLLEGLCPAPVAHPSAKVHRFIG